MKLGKLGILHYRGECVIINFGFAAIDYYTSGVQINDGIYNTGKVCSPENTIY